MERIRRAISASSAAMRSWVDRVPWDLLFDLTFKHEPTPGRGLELGRDWINAEWGRRWPGYGPVAILFTEGGTLRRTHLHGLAVLPRSPRVLSRAELDQVVEDLANSWRWGRSRVKARDPSRAGAAYAAKRFGRDDTDFWASPCARRVLRRHPPIR